MILYSHGFVQTKLEPEMPFPVLGGSCPRDSRRSSFPYGCGRSLFIDAECRIPPYLARVFTSFTNPTMLCMFRMQLRSCDIRAGSIRYRTCVIWTNTWEQSFAMPGQARSRSCLARRRIFRNIVTRSIVEHLTGTCVSWYNVGNLRYGVLLRLPGVLCRARRGKGHAFSPTRTGVFLLVILRYCLSYRLTEFLTVRNARPVQKSGVQ